MKQLVKKLSLFLMSACALSIVAGCNDGASQQEALANVEKTEKAQAEQKASGNTKAMVPQFDLDR
jgi:hypothetical protein